jgi:hypothetical protein
MRPYLDCNERLWLLTLAGMSQARTKLLNSRLIGNLEVILITKRWARSTSGMSVIQDLSV